MSYKLKPEIRGIAMKRLIVVFIILSNSLALSIPAASFTLPEKKGLRKSAIFKKDVPLQQGIFLVATPELVDPNFLHTVIFLISHGKDGALGLIINRPTVIKLQQIFPDLKENKNLSPIIYFGGPVNRNNLFALFTSDKKLEEALNPLGKVYFSGSGNLISSLLQSENQKDIVRIYAGYAGWAAGQLEFEILRGSWITVEASQEMIFSENPESIWPGIIKKTEEIMAGNFK